MAKENYIGFYENEFQYKIDAKFHRLQMYKNIYKTQKNGNNNVKIIKQQHLMKRVKNKLHALQMVRAADEGSKKDAPRSKQDMFNLIDHLMIMQHEIMLLTARLNRYTRLQLMLIFFQSFISIIFNSYNLVMYCLKWITNSSLEFNMIEALIFYGYQIITPLIEVIVTVTNFALVYSSIEETPSKLHALIIYTKDADCRLKLFQYATLIRLNLRKYSIFGMYALDGSFVSATLSVTATYIIILIQYGMENFNGTNLNLF